MAIRTLLIKGAENEAEKAFDLGKSVKGYRKLIDRSNEQAFLRHPRITSTFHSFGREIKETVSNHRFELEEFEKVETIKNRI